MSRSREAQREYMRTYRANKRAPAVELTVDVADSLVAEVLQPAARKTRTKMGPHRAALTRMLRSTGMVHVPEEAPLVELLRDLADEMDRNPSPRLTTQYRGALKDLRAVLRYAPGRPQSSSDPAPADAADAAPSDVDNVSSLGAFRAKHGIG